MIRKRHTFSVIRPVTSTGAGRVCRGFTLLEMLLVLAIMIVIASIGYITMANAYGRHDLDAAVEEVRKELTRTRNYAVDSGVPYKFMYTPGERHYIVVPDGVDAELETQSSADGSQQAYRMVSRLLPEGFVFADPVIDGDVVPEQLTDPVVQSLPNSSDIIKVKSRFVSIRFLPEGSADSEQTAGLTVTVTNTKKKQSITLAVRELTGAVSIGKIVAEGR